MVSLPCAFDELGDFPLVLSGTSSESVELSCTISLSFTLDEPDFPLPLPLTLDFPLEDLPLEMGTFFGVPCFDFPAFSCCLDLGVVDGVLVSSLDLPVLDVLASTFLYLLDPFKATLADLTPLFGV